MIPFTTHIVTLTPPPFFFHSILKGLFLSRMDYELLSYPPAPLYSGLVNLQGIVTGRSLGNSNFPLLIQNFYFLKKLVTIVYIYTREQSQSIL